MYCMMFPSLNKKSKTNQNIISCYRSIEEQTRQQQQQHTCLKHAQLDTDSNGKAGLGCLNSDYFDMFGCF